MHELGIAMEVLRLSRERLGAAGGRIASVTVAVGELSAVEPDLLRFAWEAAVRGTPDEGAAMAIEWCRARQTCASCGDVPERAPGSWLRLCPQCGGALRVEGGQELDLLRVEAASAAGEAKR